MKSFLSPRTKRTKLFSSRRRTIELSVVAAIAVFEFFVRVFHFPIAESPVAVRYAASRQTLTDERLKTDIEAVLSCASTLRVTTDNWDRRRIPGDRRALIVLHLGFLMPEDSFEMNADNLRVLLSSLALNEVSDSTFIIINVSGGERNPLLKIFNEFPLPPELSCSLMWTATESDLLTHALTLDAFHAEALAFHGVIFLNNGVRGPMVRRREWVLDFLNYMHIVSLTGPVLSCEIRPHIPTHMFAIRHDIYELFLEKELECHGVKKWSQIVRDCEVGLSSAVLFAGHKIGSFLHLNRWGEDYFNGSCRAELGKRNVSFLCEPFYNDAVFIKFGGMFFRKGLFCKRVISDVHSATFHILSARNPAIS